MNKSDSVRHILNDHRLTPLDDNTLRIRRNLIATCYIVIIFIWLGLSIKETSHDGIALSGINNNNFLLASLPVQIYLLTHFILLTYEHVQEFRIRLTGIKKIHQGHHATNALAIWDQKHNDSPPEPHQSTLYYWWSKNADAILENSKSIEKLQKLTEKNLKALESPNNEENKNILRGLEAEYGVLGNPIRELNNIINNGRITESLKNFEKKYLLLQSCQNMRFVLIELGLPYLIGSISIVSTFFNIDWMSILTATGLDLPQQFPLDFASLNK